MNKYDLALNPNTSPKVLTTLSGDNNPVVRYYVSQNPNTPRQVQKYLYYHEQV